MRPDGCVSIHAPVKGATEMMQEEREANYRFNPRAREGRDGKGRCEDMIGKLFQSTRP